MSHGKPRNLRSLAALLFAGLALSACQLDRTAPPVTTPPQAQSAADSAAQSTGQPAAAPPAAPAPAAPKPAPQMSALPPEPQINDDPNQLMGLDRDGVSALLGQPDLIRREAPAEIWQYVADGCVFEVVLYETGQRYAVTYLEARDTSAAVQPPRPCLNKLLRLHQNMPVS